MILSSLFDAISVCFSTGSSSDCQSAEKQPLKAEMSYVDTHVIKVFVLESLLN